MCAEKELLYQQIFSHYQSPLQFLDCISGIKVYIKRDDLNHPIIQGNKLRKLKYNLRDAIDNNIDTLVSFGGAYSNHIHALAHAGALFGLKTHGFIRGDELKDPQSWSKTLQQCAEQSMQLHFLSRSDYRLKEKASAVQSQLAQLKHYLLLPEGGSNQLALRGSGEVVSECAQQLREKNLTLKSCHLFLACGTGATYAGMYQANQQMSEKFNLVGVPVLKNAKFLVNDIQQLLAHKEQINLCYDYHFGGYAKTTSELLSFQQSFEAQYQIKLDSVYMPKLCYAVFDLINKGYFNKNATVIIYHSGGLQGRKAN